MNKTLLITKIKKRDEETWTIIVADASNENARKEERDEVLDTGQMVGDLNERVRNIIKGLEKYMRNNEKKI